MNLEDSVEYMSHFYILNEILQNTYHLSENVAGNTFIFLGNLSKLIDIEAVLITGETSVSGEEESAWNNVCKLRIVFQVHWFVLIIVFMYDLFFIGNNNPTTKVYNITYKFNDSIP